MALVRLVHAANRQYPGGERWVAEGLSLRPGLAQRPGRGYMPPGLHIHEREFSQDLGGKRLAACGPGGRERTVQHHGSFAVEAAYRVHERGA